MQEATEDPLKLLEDTFIQLKTHKNRILCVKNSFMEELLQQFLQVDQKNGRRFWT